MKKIQLQLHNKKTSKFEAHMVECTEVKRTDKRVTYTFHHPFLGKKIEGTMDTTFWDAISDIK